MTSSVAMWPATHEWAAAVQNPRHCFVDPRLQAMRPAVDSLGLPIVWSGNYASVFKLLGARGTRAVRCFGRPLTDRARRYEEIATHLRKSPLAAVVSFTFTREGVRLSGRGYPLVDMEWLDGDPLDVYVDRLIRTRGSLLPLVDAWSQLVRELEVAGVAHGDLQHGNVLVSRGRLRLVDLDGMFVPGLGGSLASEIGHPAFQHPSRGPKAFDARLDRFAALSVYVSLKALCASPILWSRYHDDNLIFTQQDYRAPATSQVFQDCRALGGEIATLVDALQAACSGPLDSVPSLSDILGGGKGGLPAWIAGRGHVLPQPAALGNSRGAPASPPVTTHGPQAGRRPRPARTVVRSPISTARSAAPPARGMRRSSSRSSRGPVTFVMITLVSLALAGILAQPPSSDSVSPKTTSPLAHPPREAIHVETRPPPRPLYDVILDSEPSGASVILDGRRVGTAPFHTSLPPGSHQVRFDLHGYAGVSYDLTVSPQMPSQLTYRLTPRLALAGPWTGTFDGKPCTLALDDDDGSLSGVLTIELPSGQRRVTEIRGHCDYSHSKVVIYAPDTTFVLSGSVLTSSSLSMQGGASLQGIDYDYRWMVQKAR